MNIGSILTNPTNINSPEDIFRLVSNVLSLILMAAVVLGIIYLIIAGLKYITSGGEAAKTKEAQAAIINVIVGLIVAFSAYFIVVVVLQQLGVKVSFLGLSEQTSLSVNTVASQVNNAIDPKSRLIAYYDPKALDTSLANGEGKKQVLLIDDYPHSDVGYSAFAWKDATNLSAARCSNGVCEITTYNTDNVTKNTEATLSGVKSIALAWSPDSSTLAYIVSKGTTADVFLKENGKDARSIATVPENGNTATLSLGWAPNGKQLILTDSATNLQKQKPLLIIGTDGKVLSLEDTPAEQGIFITDAAYIYKSGDKLIKRDLTAKTQSILLTGFNALSMDLSPKHDKLVFWIRVPNKPETQVVLYDFKSSPILLASAAYGPRFYGDSFVAALKVNDAELKNNNVIGSGIELIDIASKQTSSVLDTVTVQSLFVQR